MIDYKNEKMVLKINSNFLSPRTKHEEVTKKTNSNVNHLKIKTKSN